ncbi:MAG: hypothetical protein WBE41_13655, partial [Terracidiphilus sp.]
FSLLDAVICGPSPVALPFIDPWVAALGLEPSHLARFSAFALWTLPTCAECLVAGHFYRPDFNFLTFPLTRR